MVQQLKVSVIMLTYLHEKFLEQAVTAVLNQKTDFEFELIVADDNSPDNTPQVIKKIQNEHPKAYRLKYFRNEPNIGVMANSRVAIEMMTGEYMATCEGDDFWTDELKLQKQVDFLDEHKEFSICFHNTRIEYFDESLPGYELNEGIEKDVFELKDMIGEEEIWFMATASLMFRKSALPDFPDWLEKSKSGDIPLIILAARYGKIKYLPDCMAVYRKHAGGQSLIDKWDSLYYLENRVYMYSHLNRETGFRFDGLFKRNMARYIYQMLYCKEYFGHYFKSLPIALKYFWYTKSSIPHFNVVMRDFIFPPFLKAIYVAIVKLKN